MASRASSARRVHPRRWRTRSARCETELWRASSARRAGHELWPGSRSSVSWRASGASTGKSPQDPLAPPRADEPAEPGRSLRAKADVRVVAIDAHSRPLERPWAMNAGREAGAGLIARSLGGADDPRIEDAVRVG